VCQVKFKTELPGDLLGPTLEAKFVAGRRSDGGTPTVGVVLADADIHTIDADFTGNHFCELLSGLLLFGHVRSPDWLSDLTIRSCRPEQSVKPIARISPHRSVPAEEPELRSRVVHQQKLVRQRGRLSMTAVRRLCATIVLTAVLTALAVAAMPAGVQAESGRAAYYRSGRTASGERSGPNELTAAHRTLPFGARVLVTNLRNGRSVSVRINDRGPYGRGRIIDVSTDAARELGMIQSGTAQVSIDRQ
jgi:rare lipoprotein A